MMFVNSSTLYLLILLPLFLIFFMWRGFARASALRRIGDPDLVEALTAQVSKGRRRWKAVLWLCALASLIAALARPVWGFETELVRTQGVQIVIVFDVSRSMDATDVVPSRLERAQFDMLDMVDALQGNDFGVVPFAASAFIYMPLTYDVNTARVFINTLSTDMTSAQGTNISEAIETALTVFDEREKSQPVIVIVSDGENHEIDPANIVEVAVDKNVIIHTMVYGTEEGSLIPRYDGFGNLVNYHTDRNNQLVTTRMNPDILQRIAEDTGGVFQQVRGTGREVAAVIEAIKALESGELREELVTRPIERFGVFVALALFALSLEMMLPDTKGA